MAICTLQYVHCILTIKDILIGAQMRVLEWKLSHFTEKSKRQFISKISKKSGEQLGITNCLSAFLC